MSHSLAADGGPLSTAEPATYSGPITISQGGTYSGNWKSTNDNTPAVYITTTAPVIIEYSHIAGPGHLISAPTQVMNLTVRHTSFHGKQPNTSTHFRGNGIRASGYRNLVVENNYFENTGVVVGTDEYTGNGTAQNTLTVRYNRVRNIDGRRASGTPNKQIVQFVAVQNYRQASGNPRFAEIAWNDVINTPGLSCTEDLINFFKGGGRSDSWFKVHDNYLQGSYPPNPSTDLSSGSAIIIDGPDNDKAAYIEAYNNFAINTTNAGMNVAAGSHIWYHHNRIISTGKLPNGTWMPGSHGGVGIFNFYAGDAEYTGTMQDIVVENNVVGWAKQGYTNPYANRNDNPPEANFGGAYKPSNVSLPDAPITQAMQDQEYQTFLQRVQDGGILMGPRAIAPPNTPPTITAISNRTINQNANTGAISFIIGDGETAPGSLTVTGTSSNTTLVPNANIVFGGSGANRTVTVTPVINLSGSAVITITVNDGTVTTTASFTLTVNGLPTISTPANQNISININTGGIPFTVDDAETPAGTLTLAGNSSNTTLVPNTNIVFAGSGANRTVTVTPALNQSGSAPITLTVSDGAATASTSFTLTVNDPSIVYVSDLNWIGTALNGWGPPEKDRSNGEQLAGDGHAIKVRGTTYAKGLGVHSSSELVYSINGNFSRFLSGIGIDDETGGNGSVVFQVWVDGVKLWDSGTVNGSSAVQSVDVNVAGKNQLRLVVTDGGDNIGSDHGDWAGARLIPTAFFLWQQNRFSSAAVDPVISGPTADPNRNGLSNLVEYFCGLDPLSSTLNGSLPILESTDNTLTLQYRRDTSATDVTGVAEQSTDLNTWSNSGVTDSLVTDGAIQIRRASVLMGNSPIFLRLRVTK